ncbi:DNA damage-binding protein 1 [Acorus gramineus]|uniref:DNA damage-binding protein 1 n=1 Tax=Acorus gramineus TaxID=55184 RepID=A0AAV9BN52_ACOGR|nr:DNA damage-binding protein 1 [Acorus gramineus]
MGEWNYVVTAHKPTAVMHSCVGNFTGPHELNLIISHLVYFYSKKGNAQREKQYKGKPITRHVVELQRSGLLQHPRSKKPKQNE